MDLEEYFQTGPDFERPIFEAVHGIVSDIDPDVWFEPVSVGIFFKRRTRFLALRTMTRWIAVGFDLDRRLTSPRIARKVIEHSGRYHHVINVRGPDEVDEELAAWIREAWERDA